MWLVDWYHEIVAAGVEQTKGWPLVDSPLYALITIIVYLVFVLRVGPDVMRQRKPLHLRHVMLTYNAFQVLSCAWYIYEMGDLPLKEDYLCSYLVTDDAYRDKMEAYLGWVYMLLKYLDLVDTVFFVLKKKHTHVSFLHVFHHSSMVAFAWAGVKFHPGGVLAIAPLLNTWVHLCMYAYYFRVVHHGSVAIYWKRKMTQMQIAQFLIGGLFCFVHMVNPTCNVSKVLAFALFMQSMFFLGLFAHFYSKTYWKVGDHHHHHRLPTYHSTANGGLDKCTTK